jgi:hypothetical protein
LQEQLYEQNVEWQFEEGLFIFIDNGQEEKTTKTVNRKKDDVVVQEELTIYKRYERWIGEKESERAVFERFMKTETPDEVWYCKHRAFEAKFKHIDKKWFLLILPDWFFSYDGFHKSSFHAKDLKWLKKKANTGIVFTDFRFILFFLKHTENGFFQTHKTKYPLRYGDIVSFENAPFLYDDAWNPPEEKQRRKPDTETEVAPENVPEQDGLFDV